MSKIRSKKQRQLTRWAKFIRGGREYLSDQQTQLMFRQAVRYETPPAITGTRSWKDGAKAKGVATAISSCPIVNH